MDVQALAVVSNIFQILGVLWVVFFGSKAIFDTVKSKNTENSKITETSRRRKNSSYRDTGDAGYVGQLRVPKPSSFEDERHDEWYDEEYNYSDPPRVPKPTLHTSSTRRTQTATVGSSPVKQQGSFRHAFREKRKLQDSHYSSSSSNYPYSRREASGPDQAWRWTGVFVLLVASIAWVAFKANIVHMDLLWYEVLIIGFIASAVWVAIKNELPSLVIGYLCLGPLVAVAVYFLIYPFHPYILLSALIVFIIAFVSLLGYTVLALSIIDGSMS